MKYHVDFTPDIENMNERIAKVRQHENTIGKYIYDGTSLYCATRLRQVTVVVVITCHWLAVSRLGSSDLLYQGVRYSILIKKSVVFLYFALVKFCLIV